MKKKWLIPLLQRRLLVALLILAQVLLYVYFLVSSSYISSVIRDIFTFISLVVALFVLSGRGESSYKLTWVFVILAFPVVGGVMYLAFDEHFLRFVFVRRVKRACDKTFPLMPLAKGSDERENTDAPVSVRYLSGHASFPAYYDTDATFLGSGAEMLASMKEALRGAKQYIFMEYFIIEHGEMWNSILEILLEKAKAGVVVRIIYDDMGCFLRLPHRYEKLLRDYGIHVARFNPFVPFFSAEQNNRDHRKITVIDGKVAFTGGINLADEYIGKVKRFGEWADTGVKLEGRAAWSFTLMFLQMWRVIHKKTEEDFTAYLPKEYALPPTVEKRESLVLPYADNPMDDENVGALVYTHIIQNAKRYVYITTPYLIIDDQLLGALTLAAKSGVDVRIITPHIWDKRMVHMITRSYYHELCAAGVKIYEYTPGFMHAKMVVADDEIATVGSINFDYRSLYLHFECGSLFYRHAVTADVKAAFLAYQAESQEIVPKVPRRNFFARMRRSFWRLIAPLL